MKKFTQHSDTAFVGIMICAFVIGALVLWSQWRVIHDYWKTNFDEYSVPPEDIVSGGSGRDSVIVPIDAPIFVHVDMARSLFDDYEPVIVVDYYGVERAYPLNILTVHEIVNDRLNDVPIAVTFCPLCNTAVVYRREINGMVLRMGVSGNFYGNNFLMYDDVTESWWHQFSGEAVVGDFTGETLDTVPSQIVGFQTYATWYPNGEVLTGDANNQSVNYNLTPYDAYQSSESPILSNDSYDTRLKAMERVLATTINDTPIAYPFETLREVGVINDMVNGEAIVVIWQPGAVGAIDTDYRDNNVDVGQAAAFGRELNEDILTFRYEDGQIFDNETDTEWNIFGEAIAGEREGATLHSYQCFTYFWFAWSSAHRDTWVYEH